MPVPDFDQIARDILGAMEDPTEYDLSVAVAKLRELWNARGTADLTAVRLVLIQMFGMSFSSERMERAIEELNP